MKKFLVGLMVVAMGLMLMSPVASAYPVSAGDKITINWGIGNANNGGSFTIDKVGDTSGILFDTFCLERNEYFSPGGSYWIGSITNGAINGGISGGTGTPPNDPISTQTAYLYSRWASPWVTNGIAHTAANANALQLAIWWLEGEWTTDNPLPMTVAANSLLTMANDNANGTLYGVQVMNIYGNSTYTVNQQDMLVANQIPEPATMLLFGLGLLGLAGLRRKFKK